MNFSKPKGLVQYGKIKKLYRKAFPQTERKPFFIINYMHQKGKTDIWYFTDENKFIGFATTINSESIVLIDYFVVKEENRGKGYGTKMLKALLDHYSSRGVFLEIEIPYENAENYQQRLRRKSFYINMGFVPMNTQVRIFGVDMELLGVNCKLSFDEYKNFYRDNHGEFTSRQIERIEASTT